EIIVADDAAGDAGSAAGDRRFVDDKNVGAGAPAGRFQHLCEVEGRAQPVNPRADDGVFDRLRNRPVATLTHPPDPATPSRLRKTSLCYRFPARISAWF